MSVHDRYRELVADQRQFFGELITEDWASYRSDAWDFSTLRGRRLLAREFDQHGLFAAGSA